MRITVHNIKTFRYFILIDILLLSSMFVICGVTVWANFGFACIIVIIYLFDLCVCYLIGFLIGFYVVGVLFIL